MLKVKNRDNLYFEGMDPWQNTLSAKKLALLQKSWAEIFRKDIRLPTKGLDRWKVNQVATWENIFMS